MDNPSTNGNKPQWLRHPFSQQQNSESQWWAARGRGLGSCAWVAAFWRYLVGRSGNWEVGPDGLIWHSSSCVWPTSRKCLGAAFWRQNSSKCIPFKNIYQKSKLQLFVCNCFLYTLLWTQSYFETHNGILIKPGQSRTPICSCFCLQQESLLSAAFWCSHRAGRKNVISGGEIMTMVLARQLPKGQWTISKKQTFQTPQPLPPQETRIAVAQIQYSTSVHDERPPSSL